MRLPTKTKDNTRKNPQKWLAMQLAHALDDYNSIDEGFMYPYQEENAKSLLSAINKEIFDKGYCYSTMLNLAEEYRTLSMSEYFEWVRA